PATTTTTILVPPSVFLLLDSPTPWFLTLSLHDALPISLPRLLLSRLLSLRLLLALRRLRARFVGRGGRRFGMQRCVQRIEGAGQDRKSTRLNSSHLGSSYAVFCLKKKNREHQHAAASRP